MDASPETLREIAQYLRNSTQLFPNPRTKKAFEWLTIKAAEADVHAAAWETDRNRLRALRRIYREQVEIEDSEIDAILDEYISRWEGPENK